MHLMMVKHQTKLRKFIGQNALNLWPKKLDHSILDVEGFPLEKQWNIVYPASKSLSILAQEFLQFLQEKGTNYIYLPDDHLKNMQ